MNFKPGDTVKYFTDFGPVGIILGIDLENIWVKWGDSDAPQCHYEHELWILNEPNDILKEIL